MTGPAPAGIMERLRNIERQLDRIPAGQLERLEERVSGHITLVSEYRLTMIKRMDAFDEELAGIRKLLVGLMVTIAISALGIAATVAFLP